MAINPTVRSLLKTLGNLPVGFVVGVASTLIGLNLYQHHDVYYEVDGKRVFQKADIGVYDHTEVVFKRDGSVEVKKMQFFDYKNYEDRNGDGKVDTVFLGSSPFGRGAHDITLYRNEHFEQNREVFQKADLEFREQIEKI